MPLANTASAAGCPLACGGRPVKPFTPIGDGMLGTVGAVIPGGVLPPESGENTKLKLMSTRSNNYLEKATDIAAVITTQKPSDNSRNEKSSKFSHNKRDCSHHHRINLSLLPYLEST